MVLQKRALLGSLFTRALTKPQALGAADTKHGLVHCRPAARLQGCTAHVRDGHDLCSEGAAAADGVVIASTLAPAHVGSHCQPQRLLRCNHAYIVGKVRTISWTQVHAAGRGCMQQARSALARPGMVAAAPGTPALGVTDIAKRCSTHQVE